MPRKVYDQIHARQVDTLPVGKHADGRGLYLHVASEKARSWVWRGTVQGRRREISIGPADVVSLKSARMTAEDWRRIALDGGDPMKTRDEARRSAMTFEEAARLVWAEQVEGQKSARYSQTWITSLERDAFPVIGRIPVNAIRQGDFLRVLAPIWTERHATAKHIKQRLATIMDWARAAGHFEGVNPADGIERGLAKVAHRATHHRAVPWADVPQVFAKLGEAEGVAPLAVQFLILTAARSGEVRGMTWAEVDMDAGVWTIPPERMKTRREHRVPLSAEALAILQRVRPLSDGLCFPSRIAGKPMGDATLSALLKTLDIPGVPHGFRSSFRDWAEERGRVRREIAEMCLAHVVGNAVERAYRRTDVLEERREALARWGRFVRPASADVVAIA
ncbi:tyrosine-type recombinase/integrase [Limibaculum sp. M0105]|uniref:Tyrosine-type recombinase/integrase n=1 Tax=Thermohalobaculum xanthum TaxID=2753746 RepID=A0A8J7M9C4_9RHOB|nr:site-specific integrase [Thermohalobaculum xanthum]MBK0400630.1 tyrosine-type recombinase/integrase [Thermohalobaculum xanthum]